MFSKGCARWYSSNSKQVYPPFGRYPLHGTSHEFSHANIVSCSYYKMYSSEFILQSLYSFFGYYPRLCFVSFYISFSFYAPFFFLFDLFLHFYSFWWNFATTITLQTWVICSNVCNNCCCVAYVFGATKTSALLNVEFFLTSSKL